MKPGPGRIVALVIALLFLVALMPKACAQVMLPHRHAITANGEDFSLPVGMYYHWVFTDIDTNYVGVSNWVDQIQSLPMLQTTNAVQPVNTPEGVYESVNHHMTNTPLTTFTNYTFAFIVNPRARATDVGTIYGWNALAGAPRGFGLGNTTNWIYVDTNATISSLSDTLDINSLYDLVWAIHSYAGTSTNMWTQSYTNGVASKNVLFDTEVAKSPLDQFGDDDPYSDASSAFVREIIVWSNTLSQAQITQVHKYTTNRYPSLYATFPSLNTGIVAHWNMNEASGVRDDCVGTADLQDTNTVTSSVGIIGNACQFTAANSEYLWTTNQTALQAGDIDFTISAWVYLDGGTGDIISKGYEGAGTKEYLLEYSASTGTFRFRVTGDGTTETVLSAATFGSPGTGVWIHIRAWHDPTANQIGISINNGTADTAAHSTGIFVGTHGLGVGWRATGTTFWNGRIDEVTIWKRLLTDTEATALYNFGWARPGCPSY